MVTSERMFVTAHIRIPIVPTHFTYAHRSFCVVGHVAYVRIAHLKHVITNRKQTNRVTN